MSKQKIKVEVISGAEGLCLVINDCRVAGPKPWGGGRVIHAFDVDALRIEEAIDVKTTGQNEAVDAALRTIEIRTRTTGGFDTIQLLADRDQILNASETLAAEVRLLREIMSGISNHREALNAFLLRNGQCGVLVIDEKHFRCLELENKMLKKLLSWFIKGHVGESSKHMAAVASGIYKAPENTGKKRLVISIGSEGISSKPESVNEPNYPHDVYDFLRCVELVKACPEVRLHFGAIAKTSDRWKKIIDNWDALSSSLNDPDKIHKLMRDIGL